MHGFFFYYRCHFTKAYCTGILFVLVWFGISTCNLSVHIITIGRKYVICYNCLLTDQIIYHCISLLHFSLVYECTPHFHFIMNQLPFISIQTHRVTWQQHGNTQRNKPCSFLSLYWNVLSSVIFLLVQTLESKDRTQYIGFHNTIEHLSYYIEVGSLVVITII